MVGKAVRVTKAGGAAVEAQTSPFTAADLGVDEVLIKNVAVACNPKDWKLAEWGAYEGIEGNDVAGYIEAVGSEVKEFKQGDRVIAYTRIASGDKYGAFQPYTVAPALTTCKLADNISFESGSTFSLAVVTAFLGLFDKLRLAEPSPEGKPAAGADQVTLLVWGASSSVGSYVTQLATIAGFHTVAVAGAAKESVRSFGIHADKIVDYRDDRATVIANLNKAAGGRAFTHAFDCITSTDTLDTIIELLSTPPNKGGKMTTVLHSAYDDAETNAKLEREHGVSVNKTLCGQVHSDPNKREFTARWFKQAVRWLQEGKIQANKVQILEGGLDGIPAGLKLLHENKVSNCKLVARIADTK